MQIYAGCGTRLGQEIMSDDNCIALKYRISVNEAKRFSLVFEHIAGRVLIATGKIIGALTSNAIYVNVT